jgi:hypothetical protein
MQTQALLVEETVKHVDYTPKRIVFEALNEKESGTANSDKPSPTHTDTRIHTHQLYTCNTHADDNITCIVTFLRKCPVSAHTNMRARTKYTRTHTHAQSYLLVRVCAHALGSHSHSHSHTYTHTFIQAFELAFDSGKAGWREEGRAKSKMDESL